MKKIIVLFLICGATAFADTSTVAVPKTSTEATQSASPNILEKFTSTFFTVYHGGPMSDQGSDYTLDHDGKPTPSRPNRINFDTTTDLAYLVTPHIGFGAYVPFLLVPTYGDNFVLGDVGAEFFDKKIIDSNGARLGSTLVLQGTTNDYSQSRKQKMAIKLMPFASYKIPHSNFKIGTWTEAKAYLGVVSGKTFKLWALPYADYALSDTFSLNVGLELEADHVVGGGTGDLTSYLTDFQPGFVWRPTPRLLINPFVQIFTGTPLTSASTALGAVFSAKMF